MRKLGFSILVLLAFCSCEKETITPDSNTASFSATIEGGTKSYISNRHNCWEQSDIIYVNGEQVNDLTLNTNEPATFTAAHSDDGYNMFTFGTVTPVSTTGISATYTIAQSGVYGQNMVMSAYTENPGPVVFHHCSSIFHFTNLSGGEICKITAPSRTYIAGTGTVFSDQNVVIQNGSNIRSETVPSSSSEHWITTWSTSPSTDAKYEIMVGGITKEVRTSYGLRPGTVISINVDDFLNAGDVTYVVHTAQELYDRLNIGSWSLSSTNLHISLANDIDYTTISGPYLIARFYCNIYIEGNGHKITLNSPLYERLPVSLTVTQTIFDWTGSNNGYILARQYGLFGGSVSHSNSYVERHNKTVYWGPNERVN